MMRIVFLVAALVAAAPADAARVVERIVAVVNDDIILESEVNQAAVLSMRAELGELDLESAEGQRKFEAHRRPGRRTTSGHARAAQRDD